jgi:phosphatidylglycerol lysyltransferase
VKLRIPQARLAPFISAALFIAALVVLRHELAGFKWTEVRGFLATLSLWHAGVSLACVLVSFTMLVGYDLLAVHHAGVDLPRGKVVFAALVGWAASNAIGAAWLSGTAVRLRLYGSWGRSPGDVTRVAAINELTFWSGLGTLAGATLLLEPPATIGGWGRLLGAAMLLAVLFLMVAGRFRRRPIKVGSWEFVLPGPLTVLCQVSLGLVDQLAAAGVFYALLPATAAISFPQFVALYAISMTVGAVSGIPGGAGAFEGTLVSLLGNSVSGEAVVGCILVWRFVYYVVPLSLGALAFAIEEGLKQRAQVTRFGTNIASAAGFVVPAMLAGIGYVGGGLLLVSSALPVVPERLEALEHWVPLLVLESSHLVSAVVGVCLLFVARGLGLRLFEAWVAALVLLALGAASAMTRGLDWREALLLAGFFLVALPFRHRFYRHARLGRLAFTPGWTASVLLVVSSAAALLFTIHADVPYSSSLWTHFGFSADAPRGLRALTVASVIGLAGGVLSLLRPAPALPKLPLESELDEVQRIVARSTSTNTWLALVGDKALLFNETRTAFLMFGERARTLVSFGDPVGPAEEWEELVWQFKELADRHASRIAFYEVGPATLPLYLEMGLGVLKFGEEAIIPLAGYSLDGGSNKSLRQTVRRLEREGCSFAVHPIDEVEGLLSELKAVSDDWLGGKTTREIGFSIGFFKREYLRRTPVAVVRRQGRIVAFANVLESAGRSELSVDLMRFAHVAPENTMDYLFLSLIAWGQANGWQSFNLGMAPLAGLPDRDLAPFWAKAGSLLFRQGGQFYNFQGLRHYKEKFHPRWEPRYLACPGGLALPFVLGAIAALVTGGSVTSGRADRRTGDAPRVRAALAS